MSEKKRKEKTTPFGVSLMRSQVLYRAAQGAVMSLICTVAWLQSKNLLGLNLPASLESLPLFDLTTWFPVKRLFYLICLCETWLMKISRAETMVLSHSTYQRSVIPIALPAIHLCKGHEAVKHVRMVGDGMACNCILSAYA